MAEKKDINSLVTDILWETASNEEIGQLQQELANNPELKQKYDKILSSKELAFRYRQYAALSAPALDKRRFPLRRYHFAIAAAIVFLIVGGLFWWWQYAKIVPPVISQEVKMAMMQSKQSGRQQAEVATITQQGAKAVIKQFTANGTTPSDNHALEQLLTAKRITTKLNKEFWVTLDDGTLVHLNDNTHLIYPDEFTGDTRNVFLDGEAYFMVAKDRRHPFIVYTQQGEVKAYGTEFNVSTRQQGNAASGASNATEVVLVAGSVGVKPAYGTERMMHPGEKCALSKARCATEQVDIDPYKAWNIGQFAFREWPLEKVMSVLGRWYGLEVAYQREGLRNMSLSGNFDRYDNFATTIESLQLVTGLHFNISGKKITIQE